jgi:signal transduction histidine kinase
MNPISIFFVENIVAIFFIYGLAFFAMGLALALASRRASEFTFVRAIRPLAAFGLLHGLHEWIEMFQKIAEQTGGYTPTLAHELIRLIVLVLSFVMLFSFGLLLLRGKQSSPWRAYWPILAVTGLWGGSVLATNLVLQLSLLEAVMVADVLSRYILGIPGALLGAWALMAQQHTFREHALPQFGRDLVWCTMALLLYGAIGQMFVQPTVLPPSTVLNSTLFLQEFGIPVQLFRAVMATVLAVFMVRALNAFELESRRRLAGANEAKLQAQASLLETERRISQEMEKLNEELRSTTRELALLLELSNLLAALWSLSNRLEGVLHKIVDSLTFSEAGLILLVKHSTGVRQVPASLGFDQTLETGAPDSLYQLALHLAEACRAKAVPMCRHQDGRVIEFLVEEHQKCQAYLSPVVMISLPLKVRQQVSGSLVLSRATLDASAKIISPAEFRLMAAVAQQLGLSLENAQLYQEAQERESMLGELLHQVVRAQEAERQRIARELHDATGQSLTAISLGLRGVETRLANDPSGLVEQIRELKTFGVNALGELRQIIADLRPSHLDDLGLVAALQWYVQEFEKRRNIRTGFVVEGQRVRLPSQYEIVLFRIVQEALTNIAKHARATQADVKLEFYPAQVVVTISDNGHGFDPKTVFDHKRSRAGWGLLGIQERALLLGGQCEFDSQPGQGTRIRVQAPLMMEANNVAEDTLVAG